MYENTSISNFLIDFLAKVNLEGEVEKVMNQKIKKTYIFFNQEFIFQYPKDGNIFNIRSVMKNMSKSQKSGRFASLASWKNSKS